MVIPNNSHVDRLDVHDLAGPLLDDYYGSPIQRQDVIGIAKEIMRRHLALLPSETGNLKKHARITTPRAPGHRDRRFEAVYEIGGPGADYIVPLEDRFHYLDQALRSMGFNSGDVVSGPTGRLPQGIERRPAATAKDEREADLNTPTGTAEQEADGRRSEADLRKDVADWLAKRGRTDSADKWLRETAVIEALSEDEATRIFQLDAIKALGGARVGTQASEAKFWHTNLNRMGAVFSGGRDEGTAEAMEEHNRKREAAGLEPFNVKWARGEDERPYR